MRQNALIAFEKKLLTESYFLMDSPIDYPSDGMLLNETKDAFLLDSSTRLCAFL